MRRTLYLAGGLVLLIAFSMTSCRRPQKEAAGPETFGASPVKVVKVQKQRISEKLRYTGTLEAWKKINITPDVGGKIAKIYVEEGQRVSQGQVLAELDTEAIQLQLRQAEAGLAVAEANFNDAARNKERMDRLIKESAVSEQQYEKVQLGYEAAEAQLKQAQAGLNLAKHSLDVSIMKAPFSGIIASRNAEVGDVINPMMGSFSPTSGVLTLMDFSRVKITLEVSSENILRIRKGQPASLKVTSFPNKEFKGNVSIVNLTADPATKKFNVEVAIDNGDLALRPGTFGEVTLEVSSHEDALVVPQGAIIEDKYIFVVQGNKALKKEVSLGLQNHAYVEIVSGVEEGDIVIIEGNYGLQDGADIEIIEEVKQ